MKQAFFQIKATHSLIPYPPQHQGLAFLLDHLIDKIMLLGNSLLKVRDALIAKRYGGKRAGFQPQLMNKFAQ